MVRCVSEQDKLEIHRRITLAVEHAAGSTGAEALLDLSEGFPPVVNDETCTRIVREAAASCLSRRAEFIETPSPHMGPEDFACYQRSVPGAMFLLECTGPESSESGLHTGGLVLDEAAIPVGIAIFASIALLT